MAPRSTRTPTKLRTSAVRTHNHPKCVAERLRNQARTSVERDLKDTAWKDKTGTFPTFAGKEIELGKVLGKGGFATVYEVRAFWVPGFEHSGKNKTKKSDEQVEEEQNNAADGRTFLAEHCLRDKKGRDARYAIKQLSTEAVDNEGTFWLGMRDMAIETRFLSDILHPNIVKLRAVAQSDPFSENYFLVLDRLYDTLEQRIHKTWQKKVHFQSTWIGKQLLKAKTKELYAERVVYAYDLSSAINYLHKRRMIYRDLKPKNVGFDIRDDIKLFDFSLSRELNEGLKESDNLYKFTGETGSPRYMAPEVALRKPYNATCDTYSFCILLWEMLSTKTPFECYTVRLLTEKVYSDMAKRPLVPPTWSPAIKTLLQKGWSKDIQERYTMDQVENVLRKEAIQVRGGNEAGLDLQHNRRRSTFAFNNSLLKSFRNSTGAAPTSSNTGARKFTPEQLQTDLSCSNLSSGAVEQEEPNNIIKEEQLSASAPVACDSSC